jgi:hypothetical protein
MTKAKPKSKPRARSAKTGKMVTAAYAKKHKTTTVQEKREEALWRGWVREEENGKLDGAIDGIPHTFSRRADAAAFGTAIKVKLVRA